MKLLEATGLASLREQGQRPKVLSGIKTGDQLAREIWAEARDRGILGAMGGYSSSDKWQRGWLPSKRFHLIRMPLNAAALSCTPRTENLVLKKIHAREESPIVVDYNRNQVGRAFNGFVPQVIVIDGKHRFRAATLRGDTHIMAWVGEQALEMVPSLQAFTGGGGGGPSPAHTTPAPGGRLVAYSGQETRLGSRPGTFAEGKRLKTLNVKKITSECNRARKTGRIRADIEAMEIEAKSPPGCEPMVKGLKDSDVDNPYAVAWWYHSKYGSCQSGGKEK